MELGKPTERAVPAPAHGVDTDELTSEELRDRSKILWLAAIDWWGGDGLKLECEPRIAGRFNTMLTSLLNPKWLSHNFDAELGLWKSDD